MNGQLFLSSLLLTRVMQLAVLCMDTRRDDQEDLKYGRPCLKHTSYTHKACTSDTKGHDWYNYLVVGLIGVAIMHKQGNNTQVNNNFLFPIGYWRLHAVAT